MTNQESELARSVRSEIASSIEHYYRWWKFWSTTSNVVTILSIFSSFVAGACATNDTANGTWWVAALASFPALLLTIDQSFKFRARSDWFWALVLRYQSLQRALERGDITYEDASRKIDDIEETMSAVDPTLAMAPSAPKARDK